MLISPGCIPCIVNQSLTQSKMLGITDIDLQQKIIYETMGLILQNKDIATAPHFSKIMVDVLKKYIDVQELYEHIKTKNRTEAEKYIDSLGEMIISADDPLEMAVRIAILGNTIDMAANPNFNLQKESAEVKSNWFNYTDYNLFKDDLEKAESILYIGDNYSESLFDKLLIKQFKNKKVVFAVRSDYIYNDITLADAEKLGITKICKVIESGSVISGTALEQGTPEFLECYNTFDIVISKGQGNYETLYNAKRPVYFLFKVKCETIAELCGYAKGTNLIYYHNGK